MDGPVSAAREDRDGQPWLPGTERGVACVSIMLWWALTMQCITEPAHDCVLCNSKEGTHLAGFLHHLWGFSYLQKAVCKSAFEPDHTNSQRRLWWVTGSNNSKAAMRASGRGGEVSSRAARSAGVSVQACRGCCVRGLQGGDRGAPPGRCPSDPP